MTRGRTVRSGVAAALLVVAAAVVWSKHPATQPSSASATVGAPAPDVLDGATLFRVKGCAVCHDGPESSATIGAGPSLRDAPSWAGTRRLDLGAAAYVRESILSPGAFISPAFRQNGPTDAMPVLPVSGDEADALAAYLLGR